MTGIVKGVGRREVRRISGGVAQPATGDDVVVEEPLEIRAAGDTLAVTMRTPGHDRELAIGFLFAEGVIASRDDISRVAHCGRPDQEGFGNTIDVAPAAGAEFDVERVSLTRRGTLTTAACGVCGRRSVQDVIDRCTTLPQGPVLEAAALAAAMEKLRSFQPNFSRTGGIHAAARRCRARASPRTAANARPRSRAASFQSVSARRQRDSRPRAASMAWTRQKRTSTLAGEPVWAKPGTRK